MEIYLARTQGFCSGVANAVQIVENALKQYGPPIHVYHEIVHNTYVVNDFRNRGVVFVDDIDAVPVGERIIFSAHGVPPAIRQKAKQRRLTVIGASCPLVKKIHTEAKRYSENNYEVILIGHRNHQEMIGTAGHIHPDRRHIIETENDVDTLTIDPETPVAYLTQTTLSVDETRVIIARLKQKFPNLIEPSRSDICYATQKRQDAVKELAKIVDIILVCGSPSSSNSNRLRETGEKAGITSYLIDSAEEIDRSILSGVSKVGISSGASVPRCIVDGVIAKIRKWFPGTPVHTFDESQTEASPDTTKAAPPPKGH